MRVSTTVFYPTLGHPSTRLNRQALHVEKLWVRPRVIPRLGETSMETTNIWMTKDGCPI